jgi:serine acetyltransferase
MNSVGILGAGVFAREVFNWLVRFGYQPNHFFVTSTEFETSVYPEPLKNFYASSTPLEGLEYVCGVTSPAVKQSALAQKNFKLAPCVADSKSLISTGCIIGPGSILCPNTVLSSNSAIGIMATVNVNSVIGQDCRIGDFFNLGPSAILSNGCTIGSMVSIGAGCIVGPNVYVCDNVTLGVGSIVNKDILKPGIYPAGSMFV